MLGCKHLIECLMWHEMGGWMDGLNSWLWTFIECLIEHLVVLMPIFELMKWNLGLISENIFLGEMEFGVQHIEMSFITLAGPFCINNQDPSAAQYQKLGPREQNKKVGPSWSSTHWTEPVKFATPHDTEPNQYQIVFWFWFRFHSHTIRYRTVARANTHHY